MNKIKKEATLHKFWIVILLGSLAALGPLSMDMYLPGLPMVASDLHTSTSLAQLSLTACLMGLAIGQLIFGPLSDIQGRRRPLIYALIVYVIASVLCAFSPTIWVFIGLRFIQGLAGAAGIVIARASARDMYVGKDLTKFIALLALVDGAAPVFSPISGGIILNFASWHTVFIILAILGLMMFLAIAFFLPETLPEEKRSEGSILAVVKTFGDLFKDRMFMGIAGTEALIFSAMFAYIAGSPFVLQNIYNVTPQGFSLLFALNGVGIIGAAQITGRLSNTVDEVKLLFSGILLTLTGGIILVIVVLNELPLFAMAVALFFVVSSVGMVSTSAFSLGMQRQGKSAGSAAAFLGLLPYVGGAIVSPLVGIAGDQSAIPMGIIIMMCAIGALVLFLLFVRKRRPIN